jgi:hypothetical protein
VIADEEGVCPLCRCAGAVGGSDGSGTSLTQQHSSA